jgi:tetratricopeptide (TPR) repeat protein
MLDLGGLHLRIRVVQRINMLRKYLLLIFLVICTSAEPPNVNAQDVSTLKSAVVRISNSHLKAQGTGFIVYIDANQGQAFLITASHVVEGVENPDIYLPTRVDPLKGRIVNQEVENDGLALIAISGNSELFSGLTEFRFGNSTQLVGGEPGHVIGFPGGTLIATVTSATIARREGRIIVFSGNINAGNSGGPLILNGKVVGLVMETETGFAHATPAEAVLLFIESSIPNIVSKLNAPKPKPLSNNVIVLVADFKKREQKADQVTQTIVTQLRNATKDYPDIEIQYLGEHISNEQGRNIAHNKGIARNASIVLWGGYTAAEQEVLVDIHFEILKKPQGLSLSSENETFRAPVSELKKNFNIQTRLSNKMAYVTLLTTGLARLEVDDYDGAISRFTSALAQPDAPARLHDRSDIFFNRASAYSLKAALTVNNEKARNHLISLAVEDLNKYISIKPDDPDGYALRAYQYMITPNREKALADTNKAIELDPLSFKGYMIRGFIYFANEDTARSVTNLNKAVQLLSNDADDHSKVCLYFLRGTLHFAKDDFEGAINDFTNVLKLELPNSPLIASVFLVRGAAFAAKGDYDSAVDDFTRAINLEPNNPVFYWARGQAYNENANDVGAIENYTKAISLMTASGLTTLVYGGQSINIIDLYEARAGSYESSGKYDNAILDLKNVLRLSQDPEQRKDVADKIQKLTTKPGTP